MPDGLSDSTAPSNPPSSNLPPGLAIGTDEPPEAFDKSLRAIRAKVRKKAGRRSTKRSRDTAEVLCLAGGWITLGGFLALGLVIASSPHWLMNFRSTAIAVLIILFGAVTYSLGALVRQKP